MISSSGGFDGRSKQSRRVPDLYKLISSTGQIGMDSSDRSKSPGQVLLEDLDLHRAPPRDLRDLFKRCSRAIVSPEALAEVSDSSNLREPEWILRKRVEENLTQSLFQEFQKQDPVQEITLSDKAGNRMYRASIYESAVIPGRVAPSVEFPLHSRRITVQYMRLSCSLVL